MLKNKLVNVVFYSGKKVWCDGPRFNIICAIKEKNSIRDARTPQPGEIVFNTMRYRSSETVQRSGYFQSSVSYIKVKMMFK